VLPNALLLVIVWRLGRLRDWFVTLGHHLSSRRSQLHEVVLATYLCLLVIRQVLLLVEKTVSLLLEWRQTES
jgi:hypothetical protein